MQSLAFVSPEDIARYAEGLRRAGLREDAARRCWEARHLSASEHSVIDLVLAGTAQSGLPMRDESARTGTAE